MSVIKFTCAVIGISACSANGLELTKPQCDGAGQCNNSVVATNSQEASSMLQLHSQNNASDDVVSVVSGVSEASEWREWSEWSATLRVGVASVASIDDPTPPENPPCCRAEVYQHVDFGVENGVRWIANLRPGRYNLADFMQCGGGKSDASALKVYGPVGSGCKATLYTSDNFQGETAWFGLPAGGTAAEYERIYGFTPIPGQTGGTFRNDALHSIIVEGDSGCPIGMGVCDVTAQPTPSPTPMPPTPGVTVSPTPSPPCTGGNTEATCSLNQCFQRIRGPTECINGTCWCADQSHCIHEIEVPLARKWKVCREPDYDESQDPATLSFLGLLVQDIVSAYASAMSR